MITQNISSISFDVFEKNFNELMPIFDSLIFETEYLIHEYRIGTFTKKLSRHDSENIAVELPNRNEWVNDSFSAVKTSIKQKYRIGSNELTQALNIIQNHKEFCVYINMEKRFGNISEIDLKEYARVVICMDENEKERKVQGDLLQETTRKHLLEIQRKAKRRKELSKNISDQTLCYLMTFREYGRRMDYFSENVEKILRHFESLEMERMDTLKKVEKVDACRWILMGMKKCGQVLYCRIVVDELYKSGKIL